MHTTLIIMKKVPFFFYIDTEDVLMNESAESAVQQELLSAYKTWMSQVYNRSTETPSNSSAFNTTRRYIGFRDEGSAIDERHGAFKSNNEDNFINYGAKKVSIKYWDKKIRNKKYLAVTPRTDRWNDVIYNGDDYMTYENTTIIPLFRYNVVKMCNRAQEITKALSTEDRQRIKADSKACDGYSGGYIIDSYYTLKLSAPEPYIPLNMEKVRMNTILKPKFIALKKIQEDKKTGTVWEMCSITGHYASDEYAEKVIAINSAGQEVSVIKLYLSLLRSSRHGITFLDAESADCNGFVFCQIQRDWVKRDEISEEPNASYHGLRREWMCEAGKPQFTIGLEIEKEDIIARNKVGYQKLYDRTKWCKERDGSLNDLSGYELVSPVYDLMSSRMEKDINDDEDLTQLINASFSDRCGGHINIGSKIYSPVQLLWGIKGFLPLLYSIWGIRINNQYSRAMKAHEYGDKKNAIKLKAHVLEIRIASAVKSVKNLIWRRDLVRIMMNNINKSEQEVLRMMLNPRSVLHKHLRKVYNSERFMKKCNDFVSYAEMFNDIKLDSLNWDDLDSVKGESNIETEED